MEPAQGCKVQPSISQMTVYSVFSEVFLIFECMSVYPLNFFNYSRYVLPFIGFTSRMAVDHFISLTNIATTMGSYNFIFFV
uniref:Uncharacterized protein n=1 Tax=Oryza nivara TaxID=4536 RepID=A0A0E0G6W8_ORYNI